MTRRFDAWGLVAAMAGALGPGLAAASIVFEAATGSLIVEDYPEALPCTLRELAIADRMNGWGKVRYDPTAAVCTVSATLVIGRDNGTETCFQIGGANAPGETLLMKGHLVVHPYQLLDEPSGGAERTPRINRLTLGVPAGGAARPAIRLAGTRILVGSALGADDRIRRGAGGELLLYHGLVAGAGQTNPALPCSVAAWKCTFIAQGAEFRHFAGAPLAGLHAYMTCRIEDGVFADCGAGFGGATRELAFRNCRFEGFRNPVFTGVRVELTSCALRTNAMNWDLSGGGFVRAVDCAIEPGAAPDRYGYGKDPRRGQPVPAEALVQRHIVVQVMDAAGRPVPGARVAAVPDTPDAAGGDQAVTDAAGRTPGPESAAALLLTERRIAADDPDVRPRPRYTIHAQAPVGAGTVTGVSPTRSWETVTLRLQPGVASNAAPPHRRRNPMAAQNIPWPPAK